jgi:hypothetical protein
MFFCIVDGGRLQQEFLAIRKVGMFEARKGVVFVEGDFWANFNAEGAENAERGAL